MLEAQRFMVKEQVKFLKTHHTYEIYDPASEAMIGVAEETISPLIQALRWFISKQLMPTKIEVREKPDDSLVFTISRAGFLFRSRVEIHDSQDQLVGYFKSKLFSWSGGFHVYDAKDRPFAEVRGNFIGFNYRVLTPDGRVELGMVTKKWAGLSRELFTSADTYKIEIAEDLDEQPIAKMLVLSAALAVDMIFKSGSRGTVGG